MRCSLFLVYQRKRTTQNNDFHSSSRPDEFEVGIIETTSLGEGIPDRLQTLSNRWEAWGWGQVALPDVENIPRKAHTFNKEPHSCCEEAHGFSCVVINNKIAIQLNVETPLPESLQEIPRLDKTTHRYLGFEMKKGRLTIKEMNDERARAKAHGNVGRSHDDG